jgi:hypothetical protein
MAIESQSLNHDIEAPIRLHEDRDTYPSYAQPLEMSYLVGEHD